MAALGQPGKSQPGPYNQTEKTYLVKMRRHQWKTSPFLPLSIMAAKPLLPLVPAHTLSTWAGFNKAFHRHARTECTVPGLRRWHRAGRAGLGARHTLGKDNPFLLATPLPRDTEEQKEELPFVSYSDSGSGTKVIGICHLD